MNINMNINFNKKINLLLSIIFIGACIGLVIEYKKPNPDTLSNTSNSEEVYNINNLDVTTDTDTPISISKADYSKKIDTRNDLFSQILLKHNLKTIINQEKNEDYNIVENSILLEDLNLPNGFKKIILDNNNDKYVNLYISLINSLKSSSWNETLNINLDSNSTKLEFNELLFPEVFELINKFSNNIDENSFIQDVNNIISSNNVNISNEFYSISKEENNNGIFIQISIYTQNGYLNEK